MDLLIMYYMYYIIYYFSIYFRLLHVLHNILIFDLLSIYPINQSINYLFLSVKMNISLAFPPTLASADLSAHLTSWHIIDKSLDIIEVNRIIELNKIYDNGHKHKENHEIITKCKFNNIIAGRNRKEGLEILSILIKYVNTISSIEEIDLSNNALGVDGLQILIKEFYDHSRLTHFIFNNCGLSSECMPLLAKLIEQNCSIPKVQTLKFNNNMIGDCGALVFFEKLMLSQNNNIEQLEMMSLRLTQVSMNVIIQWLISGKCIKLQYANLSDNALPSPDIMSLMKSELIIIDKDDNDENNDENDENDE